MRTTIHRRPGLASLLLAGLVGLPLGVPAADSLTWHKSENRVDADVRDWPLPKLLEEISTSTGWETYVEPGSEHTASSKFTGLPVTDALRRLLGNLNFALVPQTNSTPRLFVFRTSLQEATQLVRPPLPKPAKPSAAKRIDNELIVKLKPGVRIEDLARQLGAKVVGSIDGLNAYRLRFDDSPSADAARESLAANSDVSSVDSNYVIDRPLAPQPMLASSLPPLTIKARPPGEGGRIVVGLVDTPVQPLGGNLDAFLLPSVSVAGDAKPDPNYPTHGSSMAETVLASLQTATDGSSSVQILPVDVYGNSASTTTFDVALGITRAANAGANPINLSLGSDADTPFLHDVIKQAKAQGVVFFAAAGNEPTTTAFYPAAYSEVTSVTAGDRRGNIADYANRGSFVDIVAPGSSVVYFRGQPFYVLGTSAASAYATGLAAGLAETSKKSLLDVETALRQNLSVKPKP